MTTYERLGAERAAPRSHDRQRVQWDEVLFKALAYFLLLMIGISTVFPFYWMVATSFKEEQKVFQIPTQWNCRL